MPIRVLASSELGLVVMVLHGVVSIQEIERVVVPLLDRQEYALMPLALFDMTAAVRSEGSLGTLRQHIHEAESKIDPAVGAGARTALVAATDEFYGLARMYQTLRGESPGEFAVFRFRREAEEWLGLPEDYEAKLTDIVPQPGP
jgi:hypothetical protein